MLHWHRSRLRRTPGVTGNRISCRFLLWSVLVLAAVAPFSTAAAQYGRAHDSINGDAVTPLDWGPGFWTLNNVAVSGGVTLSGGASTGPGQQQYADSSLCTPVPNGWQWSVTIPGPFTLTYQFGGLPPGVIVCGQVFGIQGVANLRADVDLVTDWMVCRNLDSGQEIWAGRWSTFHPQYYPNFFVYSATRCGWVTLLPEGACCHPDGTCTLTIESDCAPPFGTWLGPDTSCDPNPCPAPLGACCTSDGGCFMATEAECATHGTWLGYGSQCEPNPCPPPLGACCTPEGSCLFVSQENCSTYGTWLGYGSQCEPNPCPPPTPTQSTSWGKVKSIYR